MSGQSASSRIRWEVIIVACMYTGYVGFMLCKSTVSLLAPAMKEEIGLTTSDFGTIYAWGNGGALGGKLLTGMLADRFGGRRVFLLALGLTTAATVAFGAASRRSVFMSLNFALQFAKSAAWPSMAHLIKSWFHERKYGRVWGIISTSSRFSAMTSALLLAALLLVLPWRLGVFVVGGGVALIVVLLFLCLKGHPGDVGLKSPSERQQDVDDSGTKTTKEAHPLDEQTLVGALVVFSRSVRVWLICLSVMCLTVLMEFLSFIPLYLQETFQLSGSAAAGYSAAFPAGAFVSMLVGGFVYDKLTKRGIMRALGALLGVAVVCIGVLWLLPGLGVGARVSIVMAVVAIGMLGMAISPAYYLPMSVFSIHFGGKHCGVLIGLIDACGYGAAMVFDVMGGQVAEQHGWQSFLATLAVVSVITLVVTTMFLFVDWKISLKTATIS
ncbi:MAG: MFS transporter [Planctomycetaceae bacterium]|nr:MFS transporter [Planctomycetaceae bacterium]